MSIACPRCGEVSPETLRFCPACGQALAAAAPSSGPLPAEREGAEAFDRRRRRIVVALLVVGLAAFAAVLALRPDEPRRQDPATATAPRPPVAIAPPVAPPPSVPGEEAVPPVERVDAGRPADVVAAPPPPPPPVVRPPAAPAWRSVDSIALGLVAYGRRSAAGVSFEIPAEWRRLEMPEAFILAFAPVGAVEGVSPRVLVEATNLPGEFSFAEEAEAIKSMARDGGEGFALRGEGARTIALREGWRLSIVFKAMDDPGPRRQEFVFVRAGSTVFKILVDGAASDAEVVRVLDRVVATLAVKE